MINYCPYGVVVFKDDSLVFNKVPWLPPTHLFLGLFWHWPFIYWSIIFPSACFWNIYQVKLCPYTYCTSRWSGSFRLWFFLVQLIHVSPAEDIMSFSHLLAGLPWFHLPVLCALQVIFGHALPFSTKSRLQIWSHLWPFSVKCPHIRMTLNIFLFFGLTVSNSLWKHKEKVWLRTLVLLNLMDPYI